MERHSEIEFADISYLAITIILFTEFANGGTEAGINPQNTAPTTDSRKKTAYGIQTIKTNLITDENIIIIIY